MGQVKRDQKSVDILLKIEVTQEYNMTRLETKYKTMRQVSIRHNESKVFNGNNCMHKEPKAKEYA